MGRISSDTLFHFTGFNEEGFNNLLGILKHGFHPRFSFEKSKLTDSRTIEFAIPMVCFCDIPLSQIKEHLKSYGNYGIGMSREWAQKNGLNSVIYIEKNSYLAKDIAAIFDTEWPKFRDSTKEELKSTPWDIIRYVKQYKGYHVNKMGKKRLKIFYNEKEWRYVPRKGRFVLGKSDFNNDIKKNRENIEMEQRKLRFSPEDIKYIIIRQESEILPMIEEIKKIKIMQPEQIIAKLTTRIITCKNIEKDF